jgi:membrane-bound lytic murein transglycosylase MltF
MFVRRPHTLRRVVFPIVLASLAFVLLGVGEVPIDDATTHPLAGHLDDVYFADLPEIIDRRYIRVLTSDNSFDYFIDRGHAGGFQYEMVKAFVEHLNKKYQKRGELKIQFELLPVPDSELIPLLIQGKGDLIAARLTVTDARSVQIAFSQPYHDVDEVVVQRRADPELDRLEDLSGKRVTVRRSSSYHQSLERLDAKLRRDGHPPIRIDAIDQALPTEKILGLVASGVFERTIADSIVASTAAALYPELRVLSNLKLREDGQLGWATHHTAKALRDELDTFLPRYRKGSLLGNITARKYFEKLVTIRARMARDETGALSDYDATLKKYAAMYGFDWRLMAAVAYQESRFDQTSTNRSGATGLFQIKPKTAREPYINIPNVAGAKNAENNVHAGIKYLAWIKGRYFDPVESMHEKDRVRMALAAYNAGPRTLINARQKARKLGLDPDRWFRNVEVAMLTMKKGEPVKYVSEINQHYLSYLLLGFE